MSLSATDEAQPSAAPYNRKLAYTVAIVLLLASMAALLVPMWLTKQDDIARQEREYRSFLLSCATGGDNGTSRLPSGSVIRRGEKFTFINHNSGILTVPGLGDVLITDMTYTDDYLKRPEDLTEHLNSSFSSTFWLVTAGGTNTVYNEKCYSLALIQTNF